MSSVAQCTRIARRTRGEYVTRRSPVSFLPSDPLFCGSLVVAVAPHSPPPAASCILLMRPISVSCRLDVASPYAEVMFASGDKKRKLSQLQSMEQEPADGASPAKKSRTETWTEWMRRSCKLFPNPVNKFFRSGPNSWTPKILNQSMSRLNGTMATPTPGYQTRRLSSASDEPLVVISMPEAAAKFKRGNDKANEMIPDLYKQLEQMEITNRCSQVDEAESAVRQTRQERQKVSSSLYSNIKSQKWTAPTTNFFIPKPRIFKPVIEEEEEDEKPESDILQPDLEVIEDFIGQKYRNSRLDDVLIEQFDIPIKRKDLETLEGLNWLNDEVINFFMQMIMSRSSEIDNLPTVYVFNTFFYTKLTSSENSYNMLKRWTRKVDIFAHDFILIPLHLGMHWTLCSVNCKHQSLSYYDSMAGGRVNQKGETHLKAILSYLQKEHSDKKKTPLPSEWRINPVGESDDVNHNDRIPQQENGSDCGVFTCRFAEYISRRASFRFRQADMPYYRRRMIYEILQGRLC